jgi:hypothetical protein
MHQEEDEVPEESSCMMCGAEEHQVHKTDRWNFAVGDDHFWLCRTCHGRFETIEEFDKFRQRPSDIRLYRSAAGLQSMILLSSPPKAIVLFIKALVGRALVDEKLSVHMREELKKITSNAVLMEGENPCS